MTKETKKEQQKCDGKMEVYSRVVGYFRPVKNGMKGGQSIKLGRRLR